MLPAAARAALLSTLLLVSACGGGDGWFGDPEDPPLPGERVPVMLLDEGPRADPRVADLAVTLPQPIVNENWLQIGGEPAHALGHVEAADAPSEVWQVSIGEGRSSSGFIMSPPVVQGGRVVAADADAIVSAYDTANGRRLWSYTGEEDKRADRIRGAGIGADTDRIYVTYSHGNVAALNPGDGALLWRRELLAPIRSAPAIAEGRVLVRTADNQLYALDAATGEIVWRHSGFFEQAGILGGATPAISAGTVVVAYSSGQVFALRLNDGQQIWSDTVQRPRRTLAIDAIVDITGAPVIDDDRAYITGSGGEMAAIAMRTGERLWDLSVTSLQMPWVAGEFIYVITERGELAAILRQGGRIRWVSPLARARETTDTTIDVWAGPVLAGDRLLVGSSAGDIASVSPYTGEILGRVSVPGSVTQPPIVANGTIYYLTDDATLVAYR